MFYPSLTTPTFSSSSSFALSAAAAAESVAREAQTKTELFQHDIDRLLLITEALWTLMKQQNGYTDDTLVKLIQDIDQRKTTLYGSAAKDSPVACPACSRLNTATRAVCMYCGQRLPTKPFAR